MAKKKQPKPDTDPARVVTAPSVRVWDDWTPRAIKTAWWQAETGNLRSVVTICEWLLTDDRVVGALSARVDQLLGMVPTFEASGDKRRSNRAVKALEADEDWWTAYPESQLRLMLMWGLLLGAAPMRHGWEERDKRFGVTSITQHVNRVLPMPAFFHPQTLRYESQTHKWFVTDDKQNELEVVPGDGTWIFHTPFGYERPWAYGLARSLAMWVLVKHYARMDRARHSEKSATLVATSQKDVTQKQRRELAQDLAASGADRVVALNVGMDLKMVEVSANTQQIYDAQIKGSDEAIAVLIRGGNLTTVLKEGSKAGAEVQERTGDIAKLRFDAESLTTTIHDQSLVWWAEFNFGDANLAPWPVYPVEPEEDKKQSAETIKMLGEGLATFDKLGFEFDEKKLVERFGLDFITGRPNPTRVDPAPGAAPAEDDDAESGAKKTTKKKKPSDGAKARAHATGGFVRRLASGAPASENEGFVNGQLYADALVESATEDAVAALEPDITAIAEAIDAATDYDDLRTRLRALYETMDAADLNELVYRAMMLGSLAGRRAVTEDA